MEISGNMQNTFNPYGQNNSAPQQATGGNNVKATNSSISSLADFTPPAPPDPDFGPIETELSSDGVAFSTTASSIIANPTTTGLNQASFDRATYENSNETLAEYGRNAEEIVNLEMESSFYLDEDSTDQEKTVIKKVPCLGQGEWSTEGEVILKSGIDQRGNDYFASTLTFTNRDGEEQTQSYSFHVDAQGKEHYYAGGKVGDDGGWTETIIDKNAPEGSKDYATVIDYTDPDLVNK
jgi:hypothetical protein